MKAIGQGLMMFRFWLEYIVCMILVYLPSHLAYKLSLLVSYLLQQMEALSLIGKGHPPPLPESLSTDARDFILKCLQVNPNKRPTAAQLLDHPFLKRIS